MIQSMHSKVICKEIKKGELYKGKICLSEIKKGKPLMGVVLSAGEKYFNKKGKCFHPPCKEGVLVFLKNAGITRLNFKDKNYIVAWFEDVIGFIHKGKF